MAEQTNAQKISELRQTIAELKKEQARHFTHTRYRLYNAITKKIRALEANIRKLGGTP